MALVCGEYSVGVALGIFVNVVWEVVLGVC